MDQDKLIKSVQMTFKLSGLNIPRKCCTVLARYLLNKAKEDHQYWISKIAEHVLSRDLADPYVSMEHLMAALEECVKPTNSFQKPKNVFNVVDGFMIPKIKYDLDKKKFVVEQSSPDLFSDPVNKSLVFRERLELIWHRTLKHDCFAPVKFGEINSARFQLRQIEYLLSLSRADDVYVIGVLAQLTEGQYYLEDVSGVIKIDLSRAYSAGLITEGCVVLVNGNYDDRILLVHTVGLPPSESSSQSRAYFGTSNTFGGQHPVSLKQSEELKLFEDKHPDATIIFISELWVDNNIVLDKFRLMLEEFSNAPPVAFVICGSFLSFPPNVNSSQKLKEGFKRLADIVRSCDAICRSSKFVLVPGPYDPGSPKILPRAQLPNYVVEDFVKTVPDTILGTNPCRVQYCTKEIVVMREDILTKLCRNTLHFPEDQDVPKHYARSIISQSHLAPMSLLTVPVYWKHDQALQLYPTPDVVVVADKYGAYSEKFDDCQVINPGVFSENDFPFKIYIPAKSEIEDSAMEKEEES